MKDLGDCCATIFDFYYLKIISAGLKIFMFLRIEIFILKGLGISIDADSWPLGYVL